MFRVGFGLDGSLMVTSRLQETLPSFARMHKAEPYATPRKLAQRYSSGAGGARAREIAMSATASTIQRKFSGPTDSRPASGAGFMKSMAYGTPSSTANSTVFRS